jgi:hypothetical protein
MAKPIVDKDVKKALISARNLIEEIAKNDSNEAETRKRIDYIFEKVLGYDTFKHLTQEHAIHGAGDSVYCDIAVQLDREETSKPNLIVEVKRVNIDLAPKHIRQVASYAIDIGSEWILLTNSKEWKLYHITYGQPPQTKLIETWNLLTDDLSVLIGKFDMVSYKYVRKNGLEKLWEKRNVLTANNMLKAILSEEAVKLFQHKIKRMTDVTVSPEDIVASVRHLFNESTVSEMDKIKILLPAKKRVANSVTIKPENVCNESVVAK